MSNTKFGFPLILGAQLNHLKNALEWAFRNAHPLKLTAPSASGSPALSGSNLIPKLDQIELKTQNGAINLTADFSVVSGTLSLGGGNITAYQITAPLTVTAAKTILEIGPDPAQLQLKAGSQTRSLKASEAEALGLAGTASLDCAPFKLGRWQLRPSNPHLRGEGNFAFIGLDVVPTNSRTPFSYRAGQKPVVNPSDFKNLPTNFVNNGWGYLMDASLAVVALREMEVRMNGRSDMKDLVVELDQFPGTQGIKVKGEGKFDTVVPLLGRGWYGFDFKATAGIKIVKGQIQLSWKVDYAGHGLIDVTGRLPQNARGGQIDSGLPLTLGGPDADFGTLKISSLSGAQDLLFCEGTGGTPKTQAPEASTDDLIYISKASDYVLFVRNAASSPGARRAPLYYYGSADKPDHPDFEVHHNAPHKVNAGKGQVCLIDYDGTGTQKATLESLTNDKILFTKMIGWETEGTLSIPRRVEFVHVYHGYLYKHIHKKIRVSNTGNGPLFLEFKFDPTTSPFSMYPFNQKLTLDAGQSKEIELVFNPGISASGVVRTAELVTRTQSGAEVRTDLIGKVVSTPGTGIGIIWSKKLDIAVHLGELRQFLNWVTAMDILEKEFPGYTPPPRPRPCPYPAIDWAKFRVKSANGATGLEIRHEMGTHFEGEGAVGAALIPEGTDAWPELPGAAHDIVNLQVERWVESHEYDHEVGDHVTAMAWVDQRLLIATPGRIQVVRLSESGRPMVTREIETADDTLAMAGFDGTLLRATPTELEWGILGTEGEYEVLERQMSDPVEGILPLGNGAFAVAGPGSVRILRPLEQGIDPVQTFDNTVAGRQFLGTMNGFLLLGDGVASFVLDGEEVAAGAVVPTAPILSALHLEDLLLVRTVNDEVLAVDLAEGEVQLSGVLQHTAGMEVSALYSEQQAALPGQGLLASSMGTTVQFRLLRARAADEALAAYTFRSLVD